jgi:hypothetical protein
MKKAGVLTGMILALATVLVWGTAYAAVPDHFVINGIQKARGPVPFNHKSHAEAFTPCTTCHHKDAPGKEEHCDTCHSGGTEKEVFHEQCKGCHQKEKAGPVICNGCHKK